MVSLNDSFPAGTSHSFRKPNNNHCADPLAVRRCHSNLCSDCTVAQATASTKEKNTNCNVPESSVPSARHKERGNFANPRRSLRDYFSALSIKEERDLRRKGEKRRILSLNLKRTKLWTSFNKTLDGHVKSRREERKLRKVPRLQVWLSEDPGPSGPTVHSPTILNNHREQQPRLQVDEHARVIYRSSSEGTRWKPSGEFFVRNPTNESSNRGSSLKSPIGKQPTWPMTFAKFFQDQRPKLKHQDRINLQNLSQESNRESRHLEQLFRQNAVVVIEECDKEQQNVVKILEDSRPEFLESTSERRPNQLSLDSRSAACQPTRTLRPSNSLGISGWFSRRFRFSRSYSGERSEESETSFRSDSLQSEMPLDLPSPRLNSVFSLSESPTTPAGYSWSSSHTSLRSDFLQAPEVYSRSNSFSTPQARLAVPGTEKKPRRPSLLSLRSLSSYSPIPYMSMEYDNEYDYYYYHYNGLVPEAAPKLSFTQKLAFPTLVQNSLDRPKPRDPFAEQENSMNLFAKIITIIVLTFVSVLIVGGLFKLMR